MAPNKKTDPKSRASLSAFSSVAAMKFWSRLKQAQTALALPYVKQSELPAPSLELLADLPPAPDDNHLIYAVRISLNGSNPEVWRRVHVPSISLESLHHVIQVVMGWQDAHLHGFEIGASRVPAPDDGAPIDEGSVKISQFYLANHKQFTYIYDYEDQWCHTIELEDLVPRNPDACYPYCTGGGEASPHEDTGGIDDWKDLKAGLNGPKKVRAKVAKLLKSRIGHVEISKELDLEQINQRLKSEFR